MKKQAVLMTAATCLVAAAAFGQAMPAQDVLFVSSSVEGCVQGPVFDQKVGPGPDGRLQAKPSTAAPYSGVGTTKVVRTLGDGNRIVRTNTMRYARDAKGRTRTEYSLAAVGPIPLEETRTVVTIEDPVANKRYVLHPEERRAEVMDNTMMYGSFGRGEMRNTVVANRGAVSSMTVEAGPMESRPAMPMPTPSMAASSGTFVAMAAPPMVGIAGDCGSPGMQSRKLPAPVSLGERNIEGVKAIGSRHEFQIAAGAIGNEQPITVRTEQWFSPELGVVIESSHQDPMVGDTSYRLSQIKRGEPDATLFMIPADYTRQEIQPLKIENFTRPVPPPQN